MSLDPLTSSSLPKSDAARVDSNEAVRRSSARNRPEDERSITGDSIELSPASRGLVDGAETVPQGTISPERLREVVRRLEQDFYGTPEVRDAVARKALGDLALHGTE